MENIREWAKGLRDFIREELPTEYSFEIIPGMVGPGIPVVGMHSTNFDGFKILFKKDLKNGDEFTHGMVTTIMELKKLKPIVKEHITNFCYNASNIRQTS